MTAVVVFFLEKNEQNFKRLYLGTVCFENHLGIMESIRNDCTVFKKCE